MLLGSFGTILPISLILRAVQGSIASLNQIHTSSNIAKVIALQWFAYKNVLPLVCPGNCILLQHTFHHTTNTTYKAQGVSSIYNKPQDLNPTYPSINGYEFQNIVSFNVPLNRHMPKEIKSFVIYSV